MKTLRDILLGAMIVLLVQNAAALLFRGPETTENISEYYFGDKVIVTEGFYKEARGIVRMQLQEKYTQCKSKKEYEVIFKRNGVETYTFFCKEKLTGYL